MDINCHRLFKNFRRDKMKKLKILFWIIITGVFAFTGWQNQEYFLAQHSIGIDFMYKDFNYRSPATYNYVFLLICFLIGLLIAYFSNLLGQFRANMTIKKLKATVDTHLSKISTLESELAAVRANAQNTAQKERSDAEPADALPPASND